jgi:hypothetical protein
MRRVILWHVDIDIGDRIERKFPDTQYAVARSGEPCGLGRIRGVAVCVPVGPIVLRRAVVCGALDYRGTGVFAEWQWWRGSGRVAWRPPGSEAVYKVERSPGPNALEDENMSRWRREGRLWAPETLLLPCDGVEVLAMQYFAEPIDSIGEIPEDARQIVPDLFISNFRRRANGQVVVIDAGDPSLR